MRNPEQRRLFSLHSLRRHAFVAFAVGVLVYGNTTGLWASEEPLSQLLLAGGNLVVLAAVLAWPLWIERLSLEELGFTFKHLGRSLVWGLLAGVVLAAPPLLFFAFPLILPQPVAYAGYAGLDLGGLLLLVFLRLLLGTALFEETIFRGVIQAQGVRWLGPVPGIALSCVFFILWHIVITYQTLGQTNLAASPLPVPLLYVSAALPLGIAGLIFSLLRHYTHNLAGPVLAHWLVNASMALFFFLQSSPVD